MGAAACWVGVAGGLVAEARASGDLPGSYAAGVGCASGGLGGVDCDLFTDAYGYSAGLQIDSFVAGAESGGAYLLLWVVCADERGVFAIAGGGNDSWRGG